MAHKTLIGGTAYEITGGKVLVDGTAYNISKGRTLVEGTGYDVPIVKYVTITITYSYSSVGSGPKTHASVTIDGTTYNSATVLKVPEGTDILCAVSASAGSMRVCITRNDETIFNTTYSLINDPTYTFQAECDTTIDLKEYVSPVSGTLCYRGEISITDS